MCASRGHIHFTQMQMKEPVYVSVALQHSKEPLCAIEATYQTFIACSLYSLLQ
jgi:hypothetical protein